MTHIQIALFAHETDFFQRPITTKLAYFPFSCKPRLISSSGQRPILRPGPCLYAAGARPPPLMPKWPARRAGTRSPGRTTRGRRCQGGRRSRRRQRRAGPRARWRHPRTAGICMQQDHTQKNDDDDHKARQWACRTRRWSLGGCVLVECFQPVRCACPSRLLGSLSLPVCAARPLTPRGKSCWPTRPRAS